MNRAPSPTVRSHAGPTRLLALLVATALLLSACASGSGSDGKGEGGGKQPQPLLVGEYELVGDVDGTQVNEDATVTLTLAEDRTLTVRAVQPGETLEDSGTWSVVDTAITVTTTDGVLGGEGPFELRGEVLILPFLVFGEGEGRSEWRRITPPQVEDDGGEDDQAEAPAGSVADGWVVEGPDAVASAVGMAAYAEAITAGTPQAEAVEAAHEAIVALASVDTAEISDNGLNIEITYEDGTTDALLTERLLDPDEAAPSVPNLRRPFRAPMAAPAAPAAPDTTTCAKLPATGTTPDEPTREGINPGGGYGVSAYLPTVSLDPIRSDDSPPAGQRTAVLISPQYDVTHGDPGDLGTIRSSAGSNIECVEASLSSRGYAITKILGKDGDPDSTGAKAAAAFMDALSKDPGVIYFLGHGASGNNKNYLNLGPLDMTMEPVAAITGGTSVQLDRAMAGRIHEALTEFLGLTWDANNMVLNISPDSRGVVTLWLHPDFFRAVRARGASFDDSLVWLNACSSGDSGTFQAAIEAKSFVGWKNDMAGAFIADAAEAAFDALTDATRTARGATQVWQLHELWEIGTGTADAPLDPRAMWAGGKTTEYPPLTAQSHVLLFYIRHAPGSAVADLRANAQGVHDCYTTHWQGGNRAGIGTTCLKLQLGVPTEAEVMEALFEAGADASSAPGATAGRWTLAD